MANKSSKQNVDSYRWHYRPGMAATIICRGSNSQYKLSFIVSVTLKILEKSEKIENLRVFAEVDSGRVYSIDINSSPVEINEQLDLLLDETDNSPAKRDSVHFFKKIKNLFGSGSITSELGELLRENQVDSARDFLNRKIEENIFPGSRGELEIKIYRRVFRKKQKTEDESLSEEIRSAIKHRLSVSACISPLRGMALEKVPLKQRVLVRVIGDSVKKLNPELLEEGKDYSRPIPATLAAIKVASEPGDLQYWVKFKDGIYGEGLQAGQARVELKRDKEKNPSDDIHQVLMGTVVFLAISILCFFLLFVGFPEYFFYLFF